MKTIITTPLLLSFVSSTIGYTLPPAATFTRYTRPTLMSCRAEPKPASPSLSDSEQRVHDFLRYLHESNRTFRIVVVGNGGILESTQILGPQMKVSQSPASGANLVTFASDDSSFEFHLVLGQISKVSFVEKAGPGGKAMRIIRLLNSESKSISSLILKGDGDSDSWFQSILQEHGPELEF